MWKAYTYWIVAQVRDDSKMDMTAMAKNDNFYCFMNFDKSY